MATGTLYLIPNTLGETPAQDVLSMEVLRIAAGLDYLVAENAKSARAFLKNVGQAVPLRLPIQQIEIRELHIETPTSALPALLGPLLEGRDCGLVSEAGCPAIADPGANLVRLAHEHGVTVRPLVGPSSILLALMGSGLNGQSFAFVGYLPTDPTARARRIGQIELQSRKENQTQLFIETPYRNEILLAALLQSCAPQTRLCVAVDLTLPGESIQTRTIRTWRATNDALPKLQKRQVVFALLAAAG